MLHLKILEVVQYEDFEVQLKINNFVCPNKVSIVTETVRIPCENLPMMPFLMYSIK
ncbi:MAG: hypothetical protein IPL12_07695 [Bacteroidetes bacterium]|nr:hypothetical protein [Bacteroidota bacterium]